MFIDSTPKRKDSIHQLLLSFGFDLTTNIFLEFMPQIFYRVHVWGLSGSTPPVYSIPGIEVLSSTRCVLWVIVLHETMGAW